MNGKFELSNVVLYAKGWYFNTGDVWSDLKKILILDGYTPFTNNDVYSIILNKVQNCNIYGWTELREVMINILPENCWKYGYYTKDHTWCVSEDTVNINYDMKTAFVYYVLSNLRFMDKNNWNQITPRIKEYPKGKNITLKKIKEHFS